MNDFRGLSKNEMHDPNAPIILQRDLRQVLLIDLLFEVFSFLIFFCFDISFIVSLKIFLCKHI